MGIGIYFRAGGKPAALAAACPAPAMKMVEKAPQAPPPHRQNTAQGNAIGYDSRTASSRASLAPSVRSGRNSFLDDIKHEVMVNYLYQQQCSHLWVSDGSGVCEGVLLRKARNHYLACPSQLANSAFAMACTELNVQVSCMLKLWSFYLMSNRLP